MTAARRSPVPYGSARIAAPALVDGRQRGARRFRCRPGPGAVLPAVSPWPRCGGGHGAVRAAVLRALCLEPRLGAAGRAALVPGSGPACRPSEGQRPPGGSPARGFLCTAAPCVVKAVVTVTSCSWRQTSRFQTRSSSARWLCGAKRQSCVSGGRASPWRCPSLLSSLQQTCLHCSLTFFFLYFYFCMSFAFQIL